MKRIDYFALILSELRMVTANIGSAVELTNERLVKAVTVNENLKTTGYTLKAADVVKLAVSKDLDKFWDSFKALLPDVKAKPMYPDFPETVMNIDEATFRFHQMVHYFTTYGIEMITGEKVSKGWLPETSDTEKVVDDTTLLNAKVLELIDEKDAYIVPLKKILGRCERMSDKDILIVEEAIGHVEPEQFTDIEIPFKENMHRVFYSVFKNEELDRAALLHNLCKHTGDVLRCVDYSLCKEGYHFRTSQKRILVKLLESYPVVDFKANLILSAKKGERSKLMLQYLDYTMYSRSAEHKAAVDSLRNGELKSWESRLKYLVSSGDDGALDYVASRPGMMLRMIAWLIRSGYSAADVKTKLGEHASELNPRTLISILEKFGTADENAKAEHDDVYDVAEECLSKYLSAHETPIDGKKVFVDEAGFDFGHSMLEFNEKSAEGGYIRSGIAYNIPENVKRLRFFVYWNDRDRVDIDLHGAAITKDGTMVDIGWNSNFRDRDNGLLFSGDITHSNAAEYIDVDLDKFAGEIALNVHLFSGKPVFADIDTCFCGMLAVDRIGADVKLYNPKNCFFSHELTSKVETINYGYIDTVNRCLVFDGKPADNGGWYSIKPHKDSKFNLQKYVDMLLAARGVQVVSSADDADAVLILGKAETAKEVSLIDSDFLLD